MSWNKFIINRNQIEAETAKAFLIKLPLSSNLKGYSFWHPKKMSNYETENKISISYPMNWRFKAKKNVAERIIDAEDIGNYFKSENKAYVKVEEPTKIIGNPKTSKELVR